MIQVKKLHENATIPTKAYLNDAGWDLYALEDGEIPGTTFTEYENGEKKVIISRKLIGTGIAMAIPNGYYGRISDRSSVGYKSGCHTLCGTVDSAYRNEVKIVLANLDSQPFIYKRGERIAQIVITAISNSSLMVVDELDETERNMGGFGSSGK